MEEKENVIEDHLPMQSRVAQLTKKRGSSVLTPERACTKATKTQSEATPTYVAYNANHIVDNFFDKTNYMFVTSKACRH